MKKRKLKKFVIPILYSIPVVAILLTIALVDTTTSSKVVKEDENYRYVNSSIFTGNIPVVAEEKVIVKPYKLDKVEISKKFYDINSTDEEKENSLIFYNDTYMQNSGVDYASGSEFDVVSILDGTVMEVSDDEVMGKTIKIKHNNDLISVYQSMSNINFKKDDTITQGTIIGKSGENNISTDLGNHLHFELYYQGKVVNPEDYFGKLLGELN